MNLDERNAVLDKKLEQTELPAAVETLIKDAKKRRRQVRLLTVSILLDILLTVGLAVLSITTHNLASQSETTQAAVVQTCEATNEARANNKALWDYLLAIPSTVQRTPEQQKQLNDFTAFIDKTFAPRDCNNVLQ